MPKRAMSFKPTPECEVQLAELMGRWGCDRTAAIVRAVAVALDAHSQVGWDTPVEPEVLPKDPKEVVGTRSRVTRHVQPASMPEVAKDTRTPQEKADDFYRANMAKGKK